MHLHVLSHKVHATDGSRLTHVEIKGIVRTLASWQSFTTTAEVVDLLALMDLGPAAFSTIEWTLPPFQSLVGAGFPGAAAGASRTIPPSERFEPADPLFRVGPLPAPTAPLIGRRRETSEVRALLLGDARLVTLTGVGGIGKTRLAQGVASDLRDSGAFIDGVAFVALAATESSLLVPTTITQALGLPETAGASGLDRIISTLRNRRVLLVLDNFEGVIEASAVIGETLAACPGVRILVTSRRALRLYGEYEFRVSPLELPATRTLPNPLALGQYSALELFVQRAQAARTDFTIDPIVANAIVAICRHLDGLPLAIELVAAQVRHLSPTALALRLEKVGGVLDLGSHGANDLPDRQRTLRDTISWSYRLLASDEQNLFKRLAVFAGGWDSAAVEGVTTEVGALDRLRALVESSLVN